MKTQFFGNRVSTIQLALNLVFNLKSYVNPQRILLLLLVIQAQSLIGCDIAPMLRHVPQDDSSTPPLPGEMPPDFFLPPAGPGASGNDGGNTGSDPGSNNTNNPSDPAAGGTGPSAGGTDPGTGSTPPGSGTTDPGTGSTPPSAGNTNPGTGTTPPGSGTTDPGTGTTPPSTGGTNPDMTCVDGNGADSLTSSELAQCQAEFPGMDIIDLSQSPNQCEAAPTSGGVFAIKMRGGQTTIEIGANQNVNICLIMGGNQSGATVNVYGILDHLYFIGRGNQSAGDIDIFASGQLNSVHADLRGNEATLNISGEGTFSCQDIEFDFGGNDPTLTCTESP